MEESKKKVIVEVRIENEKEKLRDKITFRILLVRSLSDRKPPLIYIHVSHFVNNEINFKMKFIPADFIFRFYKC